ncbi:hypothetical protein AB1K84_13335 [Mesobacillus foraminis]|uniref:hypothetical protein n=1 Tax=Mesobacillus foraminis TaxID=279826 RepID=UPI0039A07524
MKRLRVFMLTVVFLLTMALPAMGQGSQTDSPAQKSSFQEAVFSGVNQNTETYVTLSSYSGNNGQYNLFIEKLNFESEEYFYGDTVIPASEVVFNTTKGTVTVNKTVDVYKVEYADDGTDSPPKETFVGKESVNLTWTFNPRNYSTHKFTEKNIELDFEQYLQLSKGTTKDYKDVQVTGNIGDTLTGDYEFSGGAVSAGTAFAIIK